MPEPSPNHALFPGTFDPITRGHVDVARRAARLFERVTIALATHPTKDRMLDEATRLGLVRAALAGLENVQVISFGGLVVDGCRAVGAGAIVRGLRGPSDYEYEERMARTNAGLFPGLETVFLSAAPEHAHVSSTLVRQIARLGGDVSSLVPEPVARLLRERFPKDPS